MQTIGWSKIDERTWRYDEEGVRFFLLEGSQKALLVDSGMKTHNARDLAEELTDLPLMLPSIGEAIYCGCGGYFDDGGRAREENMLTVPEMLLAWTANGALDCLDEERLGTLETGKLADIVVLERDVLAADPSDVRDVNAALTVSDGRVVFDELG